MRRPLPGRRDTQGRLGSCRLGLQDTAGSATLGPGLRPSRGHRDTRTRVPPKLGATRLPGVAGWARGRRAWGAPLGLGAAGSGLPEVKVRVRGHAASARTCPPPSHLDRGPVGRSRLLPSRSGRAGGSRRAWRELAHPSRADAILPLEFPLATS